MVRSNPRDNMDARVAHDMSAHSLTIVQDQGLYRHLYVSRPESMNMHFHITTWPGYLAYSGDMGCFVFSRINDMFAFFRDEKGLDRVNLGYWGEKCIAADKGDGITEFSPERFRERVKEFYDEAVEDDLGNCARDQEAIAADAAELWHEITEDVLCHSDNEFWAYTAVHDFEHNGFRFQDFFDGGSECEEYTYRYEWCVRAIVRSIRMYDQIKRSADNATETD